MAKREGKGKVTHLGIHKIDNVDFFTVVADLLGGDQVGLVGMVEFTNPIVHRLLSELDLGWCTGMGDVQ